MTKLHTLAALWMTLVSPIGGEEHALTVVEHGWHEDLIRFIQIGLPKILAALVLCLVFQRIVKFFTRRMQKRAAGMVGNAQHAAQLRTLSGIIRATAYGVIGFYFLTQLLSAIGVSLGPFIASAGVIGLGISFGAQSIFKDMLNGIFILIENQYNVGEVVKIAGLQGTVEHLTLRCTTLRDGDGTVYVIPNSQVTTVSNLSRDYSVATLRISVDASADPDRVIAILHTASKEMREDAAFKDVLIAEPVVLGVDKIDGRAVEYPINLRVQANQRDGVLREMRRRLLKIFEREGVPLGIAGTMLLMKSDPTVPPVVPPDAST
jgi:small-conductance mechanosensitive channel